MCSVQRLDEVAEHPVPVEFSGKTQWREFAKPYPSAHRTLTFFLLKVTKKSVGAGAMTLVQCYNKGCGQKFDPEQNDKGT